MQTGGVHDKLYMDHGNAFFANVESIVQNLHDINGWFGHADATENNASRDVQFSISVG